MSAHTPGPWDIDMCDWPLIINGANDDVVALVPLPAGCNDKDSWGRRAKANAERIVACVNTCEGIPNQMLDAPTQEWKALIAERDELLAVLRSLFENCAMTHNRWGEGCNREEADDAIKRGRYLISKAEGR